MSRQGRCGAFKGAARLPERALRVRLCCLGRQRHCRMAHCLHVYVLMWRPAARVRTRVTAA